MDIKKLDKLFAQYGYELKERKDSYRVYLLCHGMYYGAEVVIFNDNAPSNVCDRYSKLGYSTKEQHFKNIAEAENYLFKGFFKTEYTNLTIQRRYNDFAQSQVKTYGDSKIKYEYINARYMVYSDISEDYERNVPIIDTINEIIHKSGAYLIIVEAAAGFGKTCTAYELYNSFQYYDDNIKPLFTELSRNREAKLFKYVLLDEIDGEYNSSISKDLVIHNIKKGKIPLIIDGFDELLSKDIDPGLPEMLDEFEQVETMLSTIGDLLEENAKVVLTSRRTAIFAGPEFSEWIEKYNGKFNVVRLMLEKPDIRQWLGTNRFEEIQAKKIQLDNISNPVLLAYLRYVNENEFCELIKQPNKITEKYFKYLLTREQTRQNLIIPYKDQMNIFENLAKLFADFNITREKRSFVKELILEYNRKILLYYKELMPAKQTIDELVDTLTNHALLDRKGNGDNVGFVNDFVFGYLLAQDIIKGSLGKITNFLEDSLENAIMSFRYSTKEDKINLWQKLNPLKNKFSTKLALTLDSILFESIQSSYTQVTINTLTFEKVAFLKQYCNFIDSCFIDINFDRCTFDVDAFCNVTFIGCIFNNCIVNKSSVDEKNHNIHCYGCDDFSSEFISLFETYKSTIAPEPEKQSLEIQILSKYFKVGSKSTRMKYISYFRKEFDKYENTDVLDAFERLRKKGLVISTGNASTITQEGINYYHKNV